jgi:hypothetical protein
LCRRQEASLQRPELGCQATYNQNAADDEWAGMGM